MEFSFWNTNHEFTFCRHTYKEDNSAVGLFHLRHVMRHNQLIEFISYMCDLMLEDMNISFNFNTWFMDFDKLLLFYKDIKAFLPTMNVIDVYPDLTGDTEECYKRLHRFFKKH